MKSSITKSVRAIFFSSPIVLLPGMAAGQRVVQELSNPGSIKPCDQRPIRIIQQCPAGTHLVLADQPVHDENGLFVVCLKKAPFCLPDDLRPEG